jgi:acyl-CoA synthetase (NDP forming)
MAARSKKSTAKKMGAEGPKKSMPRTAAKKAAMRKAFGGGSIKDTTKNIKNASAVKSTTKNVRTAAAVKKIVNDRAYSHLPKKGR